MQLLQAYALSLVGVPYVWGGSNPLSGFDCSGLVLYLLRATDAYVPGDTTAQGLYTRFRDCPAIAGLGSLVFFGKSVNQISHVGMMLDEFTYIEAGGGDRTTDTEADAERRGACVRLTHLDVRKDLVCIRRPLYRSLR